MASIFTFQLEYVIILFLCLFSANLRDVFLMLTLDPIVDSHSIRTAVTTIRKVDARRPTMAECPQKDVQLCLIVIYVTECKTTAFISLPSDVFP